MFGVVDSTVVSFEADTSPLTIPFPASAGASPAAGNLLILATYRDSAPLATAVPGPGTWEDLANIELSVVESIDLYYIWADGTETGDITITTTQMRAAMCLEVEMPDGFAIDALVTGDSFSNITSTAPPVTMDLDDGGSTITALDAAVQVQVWWSRAATGTTTFAGDVGGSADAVNSVEDIMSTTVAGTERIRWRLDVADLTGTLGDLGVSETITVTTSAGNVALRHAFRQYLVDEDFAPPATLTETFSYALQSRRIEARELPHQVTSRMFRD